MATKRTLPVAALQQHLTYLFDDRPHVLSRPLKHWLTTSKPFALFSQTYQPKIRKKVQTIQGAQEAHGVYCELRTAYLLLQEPKFAIEYEPYGKQHGRSPDFAVTYRTRMTFHVEVTCLRASQQEQQLGARERDEENNTLEGSTAFIRRYQSRRLADVVCSKLGQLSPSTPNVLFMWVQSELMHEIDIEQVMTTLKWRAEQRDANLLSRYGFRNPADFIRHYQRLSVILVQSLEAQEADKKPLVWHNNDVRYPLPSKVKDILCSLITTDKSQTFRADRVAGN
jgi:hypothetical protein